MRLFSKPNATELEAMYISWKAYGISLLPGLLLTVVIACLSILLSQLLGFSELNPLLLAVILGMSYRYFLKSLPNACRPGTRFAMKRVLKFAVVLLGLRLGIGEILAVGPLGVILILSSATSTYYLTCWLGKLLQINRQLVQLIAAGTSICGASAIVAANAVVDGSEKDITYAIATITGFGTLAMLTYPLVSSLLGLSPQMFGVWCGMSIHEVAQVIATAFQNGTTSGDLATVTKLTRVLLVIPMVVGLSYQNSRIDLPTENRASYISIPWFVLFFCGLVVVNSLNIIPDTIRQVVFVGNKFLLCMALAAMGLETSLGQLKQLGMNPIYLAGLSWLFLASTSLIMIQFLIPILN